MRSGSKVTTYILINAHCLKDTCPLFIQPVQSSRIISPSLSAPARWKGSGGNSGKRRSYLAKTCQKYENIFLMFNLHYYTRHVLKMFSMYIRCIIYSVMLSTSQYKLSNLSQVTNWLIQKVINLKQLYLVVCHYLLDK